MLQAGWQARGVRAWLRVAGGPWPLMGACPSGRQAALAACSPSVRAARAPWPPAWPLASWQWRPVRGWAQGCCRGAGPRWMPRTAPGRALELRLSRHLWDHFSHARPYHTCVTPALTAISPTTSVLRNQSLVCAPVVLCTAAVLPMVKATVHEPDYIVIPSLSPA